MPNVFRWNIARREQLGRLVTGEPVDGLPAILEEVRRCAARVIAMSADSRLSFVGRSPEALFDYLTGRPRCWALKLSIQARVPQDALPQFYFTAIGTLHTNVSHAIRSSFPRSGPSMPIAKFSRGADAFVVCIGTRVRSCS